MPSTLTIELYVPYRHCVSSLWDGANSMSAVHSTQWQLSIIVSYYCWASLTPYDRFWWNWFQTPSFRAKMSFILSPTPISILRLFQFPLPPRTRLVLMISRISFSKLLVYKSPWIYFLFFHPLDSLRSLDEEEVIWIKPKSKNAKWHKI